MRFVRKNNLIFSGTFASVIDSDLEPSGATAVLNYVNTSGVTVTTTIVLTKDATTKVWSGTWDSSDAQDGRVDWMVYSAGSVIAADQGFFEVVANAANVV